MEYPRRFRTYPVRENASANCKIWEAARATTAAPTFFKRIAIGEEGQAKEHFIDSVLKCNNPAKQVLEEATNVLAAEVALLQRCDGCCSTSVSDGISIVSTCIITL
jgi:patatin-like phospholipase/acyl hydrolase